MEDSQRTSSNVLLVNSDLSMADTLIEELDCAIQDTGNLELSKTLNEISESYELIRRMLNRKRQ